ncbi:MAG: nucleotide exchange factor GrpE [bacterium]|nr:nucleotide exchange factor GrpE [bacterium]
MTFDSDRKFIHTGNMDEQDEVAQRDTESDESISIEPEHSEEAGERRPEEKIAKMREELSTCRKEKQEYMDGWQRSKADYVNLLKRFELESKSAKQAGVIKAIETLLPAFDALERSKEHGEVPDGFLAIAKQLESAFVSLGLAEIGRVGEAFNPAFHEAFGQDATEDSAHDDIITVVLEKGWKIGDTVIRPAKVRVAHFTSK